MSETNNDSEGFAKEVAAIGEVLASLNALSGPARERVVEYVLKALSIRLATPSVVQPPSLVTPARVQPASPSTGDGPGAAGVNDIRSLKESKQPSSANQMAAIAAYYLLELAPDGERSDVIDSAALDRLFRQASFPLPGRIGMTLPNATQAGYFDSTGETGKYKLNPVGYNLVVHGLPSGGDSVRRQAKKRGAVKKAPAKRAAVKKAPPKKAAPKKS